MDRRSRSSSSRGSPARSHASATKPTAAARSRTSSGRDARSRSTRSSASLACVSSRRFVSSKCVRALRVAGSHAPTATNTTPSARGFFQPAHADAAHSARTVPDRTPSRSASSSASWASTSETSGMESSRDVSPSPSPSPFSRAAWARERSAATRISSAAEAPRVEIARAASAAASRGSSMGTTDATARESTSRASRTTPPNVTDRHVSFLRCDTSPPPSPAPARESAAASGDAASPSTPRDARVPSSIKPPSPEGGRA